MKSDTDFANPYEKELYAQESKIKDLEAKNIELEKKLEIVKDVLNHIYETSDDKDSSKEAKEALEKIKGTK